MDVPCLSGDKKLSKHLSKFLNAQGKSKARYASMVVLLGGLLLFTALTVTLDRLAESESDRTKFVTAHYDKIWELYKAEWASYQESLLDLDSRVHNFDKLTCFSL